MPCSLPASQRLLLVIETSKCHTENDSAPHAGCLPLLSVSLAPLAASTPACTAPGAAQGAADLNPSSGAEGFSLWDPLQAGLCPCAKAASHILQCIFTGPRCLDQRQTAAPQNTQFGCRSPSPEAMGYICTHGLKPRECDVDISALIELPET